MMTPVFILTLSIILAVYSEDIYVPNTVHIDKINNLVLYPKLQQLLQKDYFRYYKVNLRKKCLFWSDDSHCSIKFCNVEPCSKSNIPIWLKHGETPKTHECADYNAELGYLNTSISDDSKEEFERWKDFDDSQNNFCVIDENDDDAEYVDLIVNPERYTGYHGKSAHKIWDSIYKENCFVDGSKYGFISDIIKEPCLERKLFYWIISGLHSSINIHLSYIYLKPSSFLFARSLSEVTWGPNKDEFSKRFSDDGTNSTGSFWIRNLYFVYLLEMRALEKAFYLKGINFYTGYDAEDAFTKEEVNDLLKAALNINNTFNETTFFNGDKLQLRKEFIERFKNITTIIDCVGCDMCKLWGKLQIQGLGTALKILFHSPPKYNHQENGEKFKLSLKRTEIVALFNSVARLSSSIYMLNEFRSLK